jgi:hypothetical protein
MHFEGQPISSMASLLPGATDPAAWTSTRCRCWWCRTWTASTPRWAAAARTARATPTAGSTRSSRLVVGRGFRINVDVATGQLHDLDDLPAPLLRQLPPLLQRQPAADPSPAGGHRRDRQRRPLHRLARHHHPAGRAGPRQTSCGSTSSTPTTTAARTGATASRCQTAGHGERFGEASLPFEQFASRLYIFHYDTFDYRQHAPRLPQDEIQQAVEMAQASWVPGLNR